MTCISSHDGTLAKISAELDEYGSKLSLSGLQ